MPKSKKRESELTRKNLVEKHPDWKPSSAIDFLAVFRSSREAMLVIDSQRVIHFWNQGAVALFGFTSEEMLGKNIDSLIQDGWPTDHGIELGLGLKTPEPGIENPKIKMELRGLKKDGSIFPLEFALDSRGSGSGLDLIYARSMALSNQSEVELRRIQEQQQATQEHLEYRIRFENLITTLSTHFIHLPDEQIDLEIEAALKAIGEFAEVDRAYIFLFSPDQLTVDNTHEWCSVGVEPQINHLQALQVSNYPWFMRRIRGLQTVYIPSVRNLPAVAKAEREEFEREGITSLIILPMVHQGILKGYLGFDSVGHETIWSDDIIGLLRIVGEIFVSALERKKVDQALNLATAKYCNIFENAIEGIYQSTLEDQFLSINPAMARIFGYEDARDMKMAVTNFGAQIFVDTENRKKFIHMLKERGRISEFESEVRKKDGSSFWISENARVIANQTDGSEYFEGTILDITDRKNMQAKLVHGAMHDALTGLPNRLQLLERLDPILNPGSGKQKSLCAVLVLDVDRFRIVNDSMGHIYGDRMLVAFARRLEISIPSSATLARIGGDEFCILMENMQEKGEASLLAEHLQEILSYPFELDGEDVYAAASIGIAVCDSQQYKPEDLVRDADTAMHRAKLAGKGRVEIFDISMHTRAVHLLTLETDLRKALERGEFRLHYQPIVSLQDSTLIGFEALIRWIHPRLGMVPPLDFIPLAEDTGQIISIGRWVLWQSCKQLAEWQNILAGGNNLTMSVNLSGKQLQEQDLVRQVKAILEQTKVEAKFLKLEVTESAIMENPEKASLILNSLKDLGVHLSLDDFGTGYSSLSYLHKFPFNNLKIDRSFVSKMEAGDKDTEIVKVINSLARNLGMEVVAEGIETLGQWALLNGFDCAYGQGYYFSRPLEQNAATQLVEKGGFASRGPNEPAK
jgi:diguanylate cyclase (GGDEF)-like protein/PAS domain S-box-containing protein